MDFETLTRVGGRLFVFSMVFGIVVPLVLMAADERDEDGYTTEVSER